MSLHWSVYCTGQYLNSNSDLPLPQNIYFFPNIMHKKNFSKDLLSAQIIIPQRTSEKKIQTTIQLYAHPRKIIQHKNNKQYGFLPN